MPNGGCVMIPGRIQPALEESQSLHDLAKAAGLHALAKVASGGGPRETVDGNFNAIRLASAIGITVFEAAGNGNNDLNVFTKAAGEEILNPDYEDFRGSRAIMVGAAVDTTYKLIRDTDLLLVWLLSYGLQTRPLGRKEDDHEQTEFDARYFRPCSEHIVPNHGGCP